MQTRFAKIDMYNAGYQHSASVFVAYCNGKWACLRLRASDATPIGPTLEGLSDPRVAQIKHFLGETHTDQPLVEIQMLLRRFIQWGLDRYDQNDWVVKTVTELTLKDLVCPTWLNNVPVWHAMRIGLKRLWGKNRIERVSRIECVLSNLIVNSSTHRDSNWVLTEPMAPTYYGNLTVTPGAIWKNEQYLNGFSDRVFIERKQVLKQVGLSLATCIARDRKGEEYTGLMREFEALLMDPITAEHLKYSLAEVYAQMVHLEARTVTLCDCGHFEHEDRRSAVLESGEYRTWCHNCYDTQSVTVVDTGERWATENAYYSENHDAYYSYDIDAQEDGDHEYEDSRHSILAYSTNVLRILRPDPKIKSSPFGEFLMGLELEISTGSYDGRSTAAKEIRKQLGAGYCVIKSDASLPDDGIEIVTAPRGLAEHIAVFGKWEINPRYRAWDTNQCGLHVHIHSKAFTEMTLGKFLMFINLDTNAPFIRKLAGRHPFKDSQAARYCAQEGMEVLENPKTAIKGKSSERYRMVNTQNLTRGEAERLGLDPYRYSGKYDTVEVRVFKASLKKERLLAQIEFAHAAVMFCRVASYRELDGKTFLQWLQPHTRMYPNLADWFGARKSKALKDAKALSLEAVCTDKVAGDFVVPPRPVRAARPRPPRTNVNQYLTPRARREAQERELLAVVAREQERLRAAQARAAEQRAARAEAERDVQRREAEEIRRAIEVIEQANQLPIVNNLDDIDL